MNNLEMNSMTNPVIRKLKKVTERAEGKEASSYGGIITKTFFFLLMSVIGIITYVIMDTKAGLYIDALNETASVKNEDLAAIILLIVAAAALISILTPLLAWLIRPLVPVIGTLYCFSQGFLLAFICSILGKEYTKIAWLALIITIVIVAVMLFLYMNKIITVTQKFKSVLFTLMITSLVTSLVVAILAVFPMTRGITTYIANNPLLSIGASVLFIIIAALFLLSDFDSIEKVVENQLPKKYEWMCAYGLAFTVIWLYFKVLSLLSQLQNNK